MSYSLPYRALHHVVTSTLTNAEHARLAALAKRKSLKPTTYATEILRAHLAEKEHAHE